MTSEARMIGNELLRTGTLVSFRVITEEILNAPADEAEFGLRLQLKFVPHEDDEEEDEAAENVAEWGAFGFMFVLAMCRPQRRNHGICPSSSMKRKTNSSLQISSSD